MPFSRRSIIEVKKEEITMAKWQQLWQKFKAGCKENFFAYLAFFAQEDEFIHAHQRPKSKQQPRD